MKRPIDIPVVTLPPHSAGGFSLGYAIQPMGDPCVSSIAIDPTNDLEWYVGGVTGLYLATEFNAAFAIAGRNQNASVEVDSLRASALCNSYAAAKGMRTI
jgi:hypothetical protein